ncbi:Uu.00g056630.m01.CDS01 [Anthostomella pinea]|uniref:Uu.00g056630.m01.CDS01 n=1 Tax=Anthostomella pinea TaxID=933095 RepID=A0AAI8VSE4_9PEZI|nr:Uu.00g056630.m01.CDS01 [Anthostomella pinea]
MHFAYLAIIAVFILKLSILQNTDGAAADVKDERTRRRLIEGGRKLAASLEQPRETLRRIGHFPFQLPLALVGVETGVFDALTAAQHPLSITELAEKSGVNIDLLKRLLRYYQATDSISQVGDDTFQSSNVTRALSDADHGKSLRWIKKGGLSSSTLDFEKRFSQGATSSTILFVDVGGGSGSQARTFRQRYPNLPGRVLLQDQLEVVQHVKIELASSRIEAEVYAIFTPQISLLLAEHLPWSKCKEILTKAKAGMTKESVLLIDEIVLPERHATTQGAEHDIEVMVTVVAASKLFCLQCHDPRENVIADSTSTAVGMERTRAQWESLLNEAGLKIIEVLKYDQDYKDSVIIAGVK